MKILFVLDQHIPFVGGAERFFQLLTERLVTRGDEVTVVTRLHEKGLPRRQRINGVEIVRVGCANRYLFMIWCLPAVIRQALKSDLIHTGTFTAALPAWIVGQILRKKVVITFHELWGHLWSAFPYLGRVTKIGHYWFEKILTRLPFDSVVAISNCTFERLKSSGVDPNKLQLIYDGLDYTEIKERGVIAPQRFTYTYFGRLGISKGLDLLLKSAAVFRNNCPDSRLRLITPKIPTYIYKQIVKQIDELGLGDYVELRESLPREILLQELRHTTCVVVPSYSEGFCYAAVEAIALGIPVVSSGQGALREVVSGEYIECQSFDVAGMVAALEQAKRGEWSQSAEKRFCVSETTAAYIHLYNKLAPALLNQELHWSIKDPMITNRALSTSR